MTVEQKAEMLRRLLHMLNLVTKEIQLGADNYLPAYELRALLGDCAHLIGSVKCE